VASALHAHDDAQRDIVTRREVQLSTLHLAVPDPSMDRLRAENNRLKHEAAKRAEAN